ncbi:MAG: ETC complex I subunit [Rickettsiales bacterium]
MDVKIYQPSKNAMQSGRGKTGQWKLEYVQRSPKFVEPLMGWVGMRDTTQELNLFFDSEEEALSYARKHGLTYQVLRPRARVVKPKSYADNFKANRIKT